VNDALPANGMQRHLAVGAGIAAPVAKPMAAGGASASFSVCPLGSPYRPHKTRATAEMGVARMSGILKLALDVQDDNNSRQSDQIS